MQNQTSGQEGERLAGEYYEKLGYKIIGKNVRLHQYRQVGEIDLIVVQENSQPKEIIFVEVKARRTEAFGSPADAVGFYKSRKLLRAIKLFLLQHPQYDTWTHRIDVAEVRLDKTPPSVTILVNVIEDY